MARGQLFKIALAPFRKVICFKREEFAPPRSKFFPFIVDPFSDGD